MDPRPTESNWFVQIVPMVFAAMLAAFGGLVHYLNRIDRQGVPFQVFSFFVEVITSAFAGIVAFMLCDSAGWGWEFTASVVAVSGHMGARAILLAENMLIKPLFKRYGNDDSKEET